MNELSILKVRLAQERHVVHARQRAREVAAQLGYDRQDQVRLATATSELARNAFRYARDGSVEFLISATEPQSLIIAVSDVGPGIPNLDEVLSGGYQSKTGMGKGLTGTRRLMDDFSIESTSAGTHVRVGKRLPGTTGLLNARAVKAIGEELSKSEVDPFQEVERQNQELMRILAELRDKQDLLARVNSELEDTNRGVVALYAELEQNANDLRRASNQKTSFLSNLSHEFRTPLNSILALCQILTNRSDGDLTVEQDKQVDYIRKSAADLSELVNDLLDVAKVEAGKVDVKPTLFAVADVFAALRGMLRTLLTSTEVELVFADATGLPPLFTDEPKLSQILRNLISNALKFTERGQVRVSAEMNGDLIVFHVADTGIGIAPADQERIFEEFVQISGTVQSRVRGTGLGLPLSRKLSELLGGTLTVESTVGQGAKFSVVLPSRFQQMDEMPGTSTPLRKAGPRILIVEDNAETRFIHQAALKGTPYGLTFTRALVDTRAVLDKETPDAIVLDRMLDGTDSLDFLRDLRQQGYGGKVVVVSVIDEPKEAMNAGADAFLPKPMPAGLLAETLRGLLGEAAAASLLLVDDDEINRYVLREALLPFKFHILEARSGREGVDLAHKKELAGIFLDMAMPGLTGLETLRELRASPATSAIPVIVHTSKDLSSDDLATIEHFGAHVYPKKALGEPDAESTLRAVLTRAEMV